MPSKKNKPEVEKKTEKQYHPVGSVLFLFAFSLTLFTFVYAVGITVASEIQSYNFETIIAERHFHNVIREKRPPENYYATPEQVKAIYATAYTASSPARIERMIDLITSTELNSIVIDIKLDGGWIIFDTDSEIIKAAGTEEVLIEDLPGLLSKLHEAGIYTIARTTAFQDPALVSKRPDLAIQKKGGGVWADWKGVTWLDPHNKEVWEYVVAVAKAAVDVGFKEINFDYIRFPSDGPLSQIVYTHGTGEDKVETLNSFFAYLDSELTSTGVTLSVDLFGITLWSDNDFNIGQTLVGAAPYFDYIAPMVYPSHYPDGFNGYANPAEHPYAIISQNLDKGIAKIEGKRAVLRPWLQDFDLGAVYTADMVRAQITATEERTTNGWMLWNASNNYTATALLSE